MNGFGFWRIFIPYMKRSQLQQIVKEIVQRTFQEMNQTPQVAQQPTPYQEVLDWELNGDDSARFFVLLPDGREVNITVEFTGEWDDGAFDHAFGTHRYPLKYSVDTSNVIMATDAAKNPIQLDPMILAAGEAVFSDYEDKIEDQITENPPEKGPDPDYERDQDIDRDMDR